MIRAMQSAIAGLKTHQTKMDVIGNNIANVNTWGYKSKSANFADAMYQNYITGAEGQQAIGNTGGINTSQLGYGSTVSSISTNFETGGQSYTGNPYDCMIDGPGFFIVGTWNEEIDPMDIKNSGLSLSRVGIFQTPGGYFTDDKGNYVYGYTKVDDVEQPDGSIKQVVDTTTNLTPIQIPEDTASISIGTDGTITVVHKDETVEVIGKFAVATVENTGGLEQSSGYLYGFGASVGEVTVGPQTAATGEILSGYLEMPNVDLATEMANMITTQRGYQANTKMITVSDEMLEELVNMKR
ncbi:flagellar hook-basal body complex protein [Mediterraneibacter sp. NSJ-55]|uniref:Flagellar hook-basal body complex protein n=1 Tax=Mediterraneibacter hominis TaxID=2763054 RepID=A0A923RQC2_9FIRM|nr:flagellar hook-basal body complex protein [Mediterraneibacter hominis]MBC5689341.1 flagellar hook-basal body complex protein [Mediterraneibacter hominis]